MSRERSAGALPSQAPLRARVAHSTFSLAAVVALVLLGTPAQAQIATSAECARLSSQADEIACLRKALDRSRQALQERDPHSGSTTPQADTRGTGAVRSAVARHDLGVEQVANRVVHPKERAAVRKVRATVVSSSAGPRGLLTLQLDNGQTWRQAEQTGIPLSLHRGRTYPVEISGSGFGGYRMRFDNIGRIIVVRRVQ